MIPIGSEVFLQNPNAPASAPLYTGRVVELRATTLVLEFDDFGPEFGPGDEAMLYVDLQGEFMQAPIRIDAVLADPPHPILAVQLTQQPANAEQRRDPRVSTVIGALTADVNTDRGCTVVDVSTTGLAVISTQTFEIGQLIDVTLHDNSGSTYAGQCRVKSVRSLRPGRTRYGLQCASQKAEGGNLPIGLQRITMDIKRDEIRQRTRSA